MVSNSIKSNNQNESYSIKLKYQILIVLLSLAFRWSVSFHSYSGQAKPKMFGDFEAQRHWMEITYNLNVHDWYRNTTQNDLNYWGLDYPPLTGYHSYIMGYIANLINPEYVELFKSRGIESVDHKLFMRSTDLLIFYPSVLLIVNKLFKLKTKPSTSTVKTEDSAYKLSELETDSLISLLLILLNPTLVLIDHGHFQYNGISLGLTQLAIYFLFKSTNIKLKWLVLASFLFTSSLNYKQMELYHALPFFFYLLGLCLFKSSSFRNCFVRLACIGLTVILTFGLLWLPFVTHSLDLLLQVLNRLFPFSRGLFEDKVANFWCSISILFKLKETFKIEFLSKLSLTLTALFNLPCCINLFLKPNRQKFLLAILNSSLIFYLFSFQVHEKSILLATVPACLLVNSYPLLVSWFIIVSNLSMLPLFYKDGLIVAYTSSSLIYLIIVYAYYSLNSSSRNASFYPTFNLGLNKSVDNFLGGLFKLTYIISLIGVLILSVLQIFAKNPNRYPDLWTVLICMYCCAHFICFTIIFNLIQFSLTSDDLLSTSSNTKSSTNKLLFNFNSSFICQSKVIKNE